MKGVKLLKQSMSVFSLDYQPDTVHETLCSLHVSECLVHQTDRKGVAGQRYPTHTIADMQDMSGSVLIFTIYCSRYVHKGQRLLVGSG